MSLRQHNMGSEDTSSAGPFAPGQHGNQRAAAVRAQQRLSAPRRCLAAHLKAITSMSTLQHCARAARQCMRRKVTCTCAARRASRLANTGAAPSTAAAASSRYAPRVLVGSLDASRFEGARSGRGPDIAFKRFGLALPASASPQNNCARRERWTVSASLFVQHQARSRQSFTTSRTAGRWT